MKKTSNYKFCIVPDAANKYPKEEIGALFETCVTENLKLLDALMQTINSPTDEALETIIKKFIESHPELVNSATVTSTLAGIMTAAMVVKLAGIEDGANRYVLPTAGLTPGGIRTTSTVNSSNGMVPMPIVDGVLYYPEKTETVKTLESQIGDISISGENGVLTIEADDGTAIHILG